MLSVKKGEWLSKNKNVDRKQFLNEEKQLDILLYFKENNENSQKDASRHLTGTSKTPLNFCKFRNHQRKTAMPDFYFAASTLKLTFVQTSFLLMKQFPIRPFFKKALINRTTRMNN